MITIKGYKKEDVLIKKLKGMSKAFGYTLEIGESEVKECEDCGYMEEHCSQLIAHKEELKANIEELKAELNNLKAEPKKRGPKPKKD